MLKYAYLRFGLYSVIVQLQNRDKIARVCNCDRLEYTHKERVKTLLKKFKLKWEYIEHKLIKRVIIEKLHTFDMALIGCVIFTNLYINIHLRTNSTLHTTASTNSPNKNLYE